MFNLAGPITFCTHHPSTLHLPPLHLHPLHSPPSIPPYPPPTIHPPPFISTLPPSIPWSSTQYACPPSTPHPSTLRPPPPPPTTRPLPCTPSIRRPSFIFSRSACAAAAQGFESKRNCKTLQRKQHCQRKGCCGVQGGPGSQAVAGQGLSSPDLFGTVDAVAVKTLLHGDEPGRKESRGNRVGQVKRYTGERQTFSAGVIFGPTCKGYGVLIFSKAPKATLSLMRRDFGNIVKIYTTSTGSCQAALPPTRHLIPLNGTPQYSKNGMIHDLIRRDLNEKLRQLSFRAVDFSKRPSPDLRKPGSKIYSDV